MRAIVWGLFGLVLAAVMAQAEGTPDDWQKLAQPTVNDFAECARGEVDRQWKSSTDAGDIAAGAVESCEERLEPLRSILAHTPFGAKEEEIAATLEQIKVEVHDAAQADVEKRRKE